MVAVGCLKTRVFCLVGLYIHVILNDYALFLLLRVNAIIICLPSYSYSYIILVGVAMSPGPQSPDFFKCHY